MIPVLYTVFIDDKEKKNLISELLVDLFKECTDFSFM